MKAVQKITRLQLKVNEEDNTILLGIVSAEPDYRLSLSINKKFRVSLKNTSPVRIHEDNGPDLSFSRFSYTNTGSGMAFNLVSNRSGNNYLLKKLKNVDYLLQIHDPENENNNELITLSLREIDAVNAVFNIDLGTFKDKNLHYLIQ